MRWVVTYVIRSGIDDSVVTTDEVRVKADSEIAARREALAWVEANDIHDDPRIEPMIQLTYAEEV